MVIDIAKASDEVLDATLHIVACGAQLMPDLLLLVGIVNKRIDNTLVRLQIHVPLDCLEADSKGNEAVNAREQGSKSTGEGDIGQKEGLDKGRQMPAMGNSQCLRIMSAHGWTSLGGWEAGNMVSGGSLRSLRWMVL